MWFSYEVGWIPRIIILYKAWTRDKHDLRDLYTVENLNKERDTYVLLLVHSSLKTYIGASDVDVDGQWKWIDGSAFEFTRWAEGEPGGGTEENCLEMDSTAVGQGGWHDISCSSESTIPYAYVCAYDAGKCCQLRLDKVLEVECIWCSYSKRYKTSGLF